MKNRPSSSSRGARQVPLDHLRPGGRPREDDAAEPDATEAPPQASSRSAQPAEPATPGAGKGDAERGKATGSPAAVGTRPHLEDSGQSPR